MELAGRGSALRWGKTSSNLQQEDSYAQVTSVDRRCRDRRCHRPRGRADFIAAAEQPAVLDLAVNDLAVFAVLDLAVDRCWRRGWRCGWRTVHQARFRQG